MRRCVLATCVVIVLALPVAAQDLTAFVEADDGVLLATDVYLPDGDGPWPAVLIRTPYTTAREIEVAVCLEFEAAGFACVLQDMRGLGASGGEVSAMAEHEPADGQTTVRSGVAEQPWCTGVVGGSGISAMGESQYRMAPDAPPQLTAMAPCIAAPDAYHHLVYWGGVLREEIVAVLIEAFGLEIPEISRFLDDSWEAVQPIARVDEMTAPGLHMGGWYDCYLQGTLDGFAAIQEHGGDGARGNQKLVVGPWIHSERVGSAVNAGHLVYPDAVRERLPMELAWNEYWLSSVPNGVDEWPAVSIYLMGAASSPLFAGYPVEENPPGNVWIALDGWPPPAVVQPLYPGADGSLTRSLPADGLLELVIDPEDPVPTVGGTNLTIAHGPRDQRPIEVRDDVLVFTTDELTHPFTVMGRVYARLWIRPDTTDLDLAVRLSDVYPSGHSMLVMDGIQRARMRCSDTSECFLTPGEPTEITVDLWSTALVFNRGHRIRMSISGSNWPRFEVNPNHGGDLDGDQPGIVARPEILFGPDYPSRVELPVPIIEPRDGGDRVELLAVGRARD